MDCFYKNEFSTRGYIRLCPVNYRVGVTKVSTGLLA
jgi:hypothetical protein